MAKEKKRKHELHKMIVEEAQKNPDCGGFVSIEIYKVGPWNSVGKRTTPSSGEKTSSLVCVRRHC